MATFNHKNVEIVMDASAKFVFTLSGKEYKKPSLDAAKKFIDKSSATGFSAFNALTIHREGYSDRAVCRVQEHRVTGIRIVGRTRWKKYEFVTPTTQLSFVIEATDENKKLAAEIVAYRNESIRITNEREEVAKEMERRLKRINADNYAMQTLGWPAPNK